MLKFMSAHFIKKTILVRMKFFLKIKSKLRWLHQIWGLVMEKWLSGKMSDCGQIWGEGNGETENDHDMK